MISDRENGCPHRPSANSVTIFNIKFIINGLFLFSARAAEKVCAVFYVLIIINIYHLAMIGSALTVR